MIHASVCVQQDSAIRQRVDEEPVEITKDTSVPSKNLTRQHCGGLEMHIVRPGSGENTVRWVNRKTLARQLQVDHCALTQETVHSM